MQTLFSSGEARRLTGASLRQLIYWDETDIIRPHAAPAKGQGSRRLYTFQDLVQIKVLMRLRRARVSLQKIRTVLALLTAMVDEPAPFAELDILTDGRQVLIRRSNDDMVDALTQSYVLRLPVSELLQEVRLELLPASATEDSTSSRAKVGSIT